MTVRSTTTKRQANEVAWLKALYRLWPVQEEQPDVNYLRIAEQIGATAAPLSEGCRRVREIGALITRLTYVRGRRSFWTLAVPESDAIDRLHAYHQREITTMQNPSETELVASVGEDAPTSEAFAALKPIRKDEQEALVAAVRQYASRKETLHTTLAQLERAGIEARSDAFIFKTDPQYEAIMLVLPLIDRQRTQIENLTARVDQYAEGQKPLRDRITELENENRLQKRYIERITEANVPEESRVASGR